MLCITSKCRWIAITVCLYFLLTVPVYSQRGDAGQNDKAMLAPPDGKGLGNALIGGIPVNLFTGTASPSYPLCEAVGRSLSVPVSLYYTAGNGVQVASVASEVGTGWALSAGGSVQCEVRGRPDELDSDNKAWVPGVIDRTSGTYAAQFMCDGKDSEFDIYHLSAMGLQADFAINGGTDIRVLNDPTLTVEVNYALGTKRISEIIATDANGTRFRFSQSESTRIQVQTRRVSDGFIPAKNDFTYISSWT